MGQERWESKYTCPCGQGVVIEQVTSYDNGYSPDDHAASVQCDVCKGMYRYEETLYVDRGTVMKATNLKTGENIELAEA